MFHKIPQIPGALFLDFDEVINLSAEPDASGFIGGTVIAKNDLCKLNTFCKKTHIPIYIITNRSDSEKNKELVTRHIAEVGGFSKDNEIGGFKVNRIHYLGIDSPVRPRKKGGSSASALMATRSSKVNRIKSIHIEEFKYLPPNAILMLDDKDENLIPISDAGYLTLKVEENSQVHFDQAKECLQELINKKYLAVDETASVTASTAPTLALAATLIAKGRSQSTGKTSKPKCARQLFTNSSDGSACSSSSHLQVTGGFGLLFQGPISQPQDSLKKQSEAPSSSYLTSTSPT